MRLFGNVQKATLPARELLPGDIVELHAGDKVPADMRMVKLVTATLRAEQASLTGESVAVQKRLEPVGPQPFPWGLNVRDSQASQIGTVWRLDSDWGIHAISRKIVNRIRLCLHLCNTSSLLGPSHSHTL